MRLLFPTWPEKGAHHFSPSLYHVLCTHLSAKGWRSYLACANATAINTHMYANLKILLQPANNRTSLGAHTLTYVLFYCASVLCHSLGKCFGLVDLFAGTHTHARVDKLTFSRGWVETHVCVSACECAAGCMLGWGWVGHFEWNGHTVECVRKINWVLDYICTSPLCLGRISLGWGW